MKALSFCLVLAAAGLLGSAPAVRLRAAEVLSLTNREGKTIEAEVGEIGKVEVVVTVNGRVFLIRIDSLDAESAAKVVKLREERAAVVKKAEEEAAAVERARLERVDRERAASVDFRGVYVGMQKEDVKAHVERTCFGWDFNFTQTDGTWCSLKVMPPENGESAEEYAAFRNLAVDGEGVQYRWQTVMVLLEEERVYSLGVQSAPVAMEDLKLKLTPWLTAMRKALEQKYGKPAVDTDLEKLNLLTAPEGGFTQALARWEVGARHVVDLRIGNLHGEGRYYGLIRYTDKEVDAKVRARKERVKGGL